MLEHSPFAAHLGTNYAPNEAERDQIRALLVDPDRELGQIDAAIGRLREQIAELETARAPLAAKVDAHRELLSPVRQIPDEVLGDIFIACLPPTHNALIHPKEAPLMFRLICHRWRAVALSTPGLWSSMNLPICINYKSYDAPLLNVAGPWLKRAGELPLSISLTTSPFDSMTSEPEQFQVIQSIEDQARRIVSFLARAHVGQIRSILTAELPRLQELALLCPSSDSPEDRFDRFQWLARAPKLTRVSLYITSDGLSLPLNWGALTVLNLTCFPGGPARGLDLTSAWAVLQSCPRLVRCNLRTTQTESAQPVLPDSPVVLSQLRNLSIAGDFQPADFIRPLIMPQLHMLGLGWNLHDWYKTAVRGTGSGGEFVLHLRDDLDAAQLTRVLPLIPPVTRIEMFAYNSDQLEAISTSSMLQALSSVDFGDRVTAEQIETFTVQRYAAGHPLKTIKAILNSENTITTLRAQLQELIETGLELQLTCEGRRYRRIAYDPKDGISLASL